MISTIITEGFGTFGKIALIITDGYNTGFIPTAGVPFRTLMGVGV